MWTDRPKFLWSLFVGAALAAALAGCGSNNPSAPSTPSDEQILTSIVTGTGGDSTATQLFDLETMMSPDPPSGAPRLPFGLAPIDTRFWWREPVRPFEHTVTVRVSGDSAFVHAEATITGTLHLVTLPGRVDHTKLFTDVATREAIFHRFTDSTRVFLGGWRLMAASNVGIASPGATVGIDSVAITRNPQSGGATRVITNPLAMQKRGEVLHVEPDDSLLVRVYTSGDSARAFVHTGRANGLRRRPLPATADRHVFEGGFRAPHAPGIYQAAVDILRYETLYDDDAATYPYDSVTWMVLYSDGGLLGSQ